MPGKKKAPTRRAKLKDPVLPAVNPVVEDHLVPSESLPFPIVAIGASAGGLDAFTSLLSHLAPNTGMAFVMLQHLSPTQQSLLSEILARSTSMPVRAVTENMAVEPDHVYVIAPGNSLVFGGGMLQVSPRTEPRGQQRPIDHFMRSLAQEQGHKAIGVVLSGTGNDGSLGIQEVKAGGGITFAQDDTAEQSSMPRSAVATGAVDFVLPAAEIGRELGRIAQHPYVGPALDEGHLTLNETSLQRVLALLRGATGADFGGYKRNTLNRRITRRMVLHKLEGLQEYVRFLQKNPGEVEALFQDILINVTSFFRNPDAYEALKTVVFPALTRERERREPVRIWALGCSTGEEAYSLAIAYTEYAEATGLKVPAQIFATDLNGPGIEKARAGIYARGITQDVSPERLRRFFMETDGSYRITKPIRDMCVFARQDVLADPPFSRLDLVACRNMLIYLDGSLQQRMIPMLHYALRKGGFLWLGNSETIGSYRDLFEILDAKHKIYTRKPEGHPSLIPPAYRWERRHGTAAGIARVRDDSSGDPHRDADRLLISRYAPPSVLLNEELEILQFRGDTGPYLSPAPGRATHNVLKMLREGLLVGVRGAINRARKDGLPVRVKDLRVRANGGWREVDVEVSPIKPRASGGGAYLVVFEEGAPGMVARARQLEEEAVANVERTSRNKGASGGDKQIRQLEEELSTTREYLQSVIEQQEASNEELQSANEEVQSANEELQSINEELETSKEEIQSSNEELATINDELQNRNVELSRSNNDLTNLLSSVQLPIIMLGPDLRIRRFTPAAEKLFSLIPGDVGRPVSDVKLNLPGDDLEKMVEEVVDSMAVRERDVRDRSGRWYSLRVRPYRTLENRIDGAVIVMVDIDDLKRGEQALRESEARFEVLASTAPVLIWMNDLRGCRFVNRAFEDFVGELEADIQDTNIARFVHRDERDEFESLYQDALAGPKTFESRARFRRADGEYRWMKTIGNPRFHSDGRLVGFVGGTFDITDMKEAEAALLELDRGKNEFLAMLAHELRNPLSGVRNASRLLGEGNSAANIARAKEIIDRQTGNMIRMIDDLLDVSRITQGKITLRLEAVDLIGVARGAIDATAAERDSRQQALAMDMGERPVWVQGDPVRLEQIVTNLLHNASKFTRPGGRVSINLEVEPTRGGDGANAVLRVRDNGIGIEAALLPRIFDLFVQAEHPDDHGRAGVGLGLAVARRLVEMHQGTIEAFSGGPGLGSEFTVRIPVTSAPAERAKGGRGTQAAARKPRRVLIVDDNLDSAESTKTLFASVGHDVQTVLNGTDATQAALTMHPEVVLLDIGLPDIDGYAVAREMRGHPELSKALIVATTGFSRPEDIEKARHAGINEHMTKPIDLDKLLDLIDRLEG